MILICYLNKLQTPVSGTLKYLEESVTGLEIGIWNWQVGSCVAIGTVRFIQWGCQQMHRQVGMTLLHMHEVFPARKGKQMIMTSFSWCHCHYAYVEGWEYIRGSAHELKAIVWVFGNCTLKLPCEKPPTLCCGLLWCLLWSESTSLQQSVIYLFSCMCLRLSWVFLV